MVHQYSQVIVVKQPLGSPLSAVVSVLGDCSLDEGHQSSVPVVHNSCDIDVSFHILRVFGDEVGGVDAAQGVRAEYDPAHFQMIDESDEQKGEVLGCAFVGAASLVLAVKAGDGEIDPSATFPHFLLQPRPLHMVSRCSMQRQNSMPESLLAVSDVAVPPFPEFHSFLGPGLIQGLLLLCESHPKSLQIAVHQLLHEVMLSLALLLVPFVDDMVILLL